MTIDHLPNIILGFAYIAMAATPLWVSTTRASWLLRATFVMCGTHHLATGYATAWWVVYLDWNAAFLSVFNIALLLKDHEVITTVRKS